MTYTKTGNGTTWKDSLNRSGNGDTYPRKDFYPLHDWKEGEEVSIDLHGVWLTASVYHLSPFSDT